MERTLQPREFEFQNSHKKTEIRILTERTPMQTTQSLIITQTMRSGIIH